MRFVERPETPPKVLSAPPFQRMRQEYLRFLSLDPKERAQTRPPDRHLPTEIDLLPDLAALFHGKCAFCDSRGTLQPYRFRPTSEALPYGDRGEGHLYYGWLSDTWQNLYPICSGCLPTQPNRFPIRGERPPVPLPSDYTPYAEANDGRWPHPTDEEPLLLDPCADRDIAAHLTPLGHGRYEVLTDRGQETLLAFNLNRDDLVARRRAAFVELERRLSDGEVPDIPPEAEFAGALAQIVQRFRTETFGHFADAPPTTGADTPEPAQAPVHWHLARVEIEAFKSLEHVVIEMPTAATGAPEPALLILGENATGKSSLLEAIALAMIPDEAREELKDEMQGLILDPRYLGSLSQKVRDESRVTLGFAAADGATMTRTLTLSPNGATVTGDVPETLPVFAYGAYRHYRNDYRRWSAERPVISLFRSDNLLSNPERWLTTLDEADFDMVVRALRDIVGGSFRFIDRRDGKCLMVTEAEGVSSRTPLAAVSSGFRTILALTCDVMRWAMDRRRNPDFTTLDMSRGLVLIDEVEAHLHPRWKVMIMDGLRRALPGMTFIVTTHDPLCLRGMRDGEVLVLQRIPGTAAGSDLPVMVETLTALPDVTKLTIEQLLSSDLFSLFDTDDPVTGQAMADLADALVASRAGTPPGPRAQTLLARFSGEIDGALPVGSTEVSRLVHEAVADWVIARRSLPAAKASALREATKQRIRNALGPA